MSVTVLTCSADEILRGNLQSANNNQQINGKLTIPEYQRPYCWQHQQLTQLVDDIQAHNLQTPELPYYLGSLILHQTDGTLNIIDGQQRITTLALISCVKDSRCIDLSFESPLSQQQIKHNLDWLLKQSLAWFEKINIQHLQFTVVITDSEDDAYRFFETQNTGGVRLGGADIIKAHHLRAVSKPYQLSFAKAWEALGPLDASIHALLKARYWQLVDFRDLPSHQEKKQLRDAIVAELAQSTAVGKDVAFGRVCREISLAGGLGIQIAQSGYDVRQPLNAGVNTINYLSYFQSIYKRYWLQPELPHLQGYQKLIAWIKKLEGCGYLKALYESCLLLYICQFGENELEKAAKKIFRVVYSRRVSNQKAVRENSIPAFVKDYPVLDWIALSYTPKQCFSYFDAFELIVDSSNLDKNSVKKRFIEQVVKQFELKLDPERYSAEFSTAFTKTVMEDLE